MSDRAGKLVYIDTVEANCKTAAILGARVARYVEANGFTLTDDKAAADFVVVNGCGFDQVHERLTTEAAAAALSGRKPGARVVSVGCLNRIFDLMKAIHERFPEIGVELCYINPGWIERQRERYLEMFARGNVASANLSVQSGSDRIVELMGRHYRAETVVSFVEEVRRLSPRTMVWGHMLVNYPTETWPEFAKTLWVGRCLDFYYAFIYSPREGTASAALPETSPPSLGRVKQELCYLAQGVRTVGTIVRPFAARS